MATSMVKRFFGRLFGASPRAEPRHEEGIVSSSFPDLAHLEDTQKIPDLVEQPAPGFRLSSTPTSKPQNAMGDSA
jgi:hypothetical protein